MGVLWRMVGLTTPDVYRLVERGVSPVPPDLEAFLGAAEAAGDPLRATCDLIEACGRSPAG